SPGAGRREGSLQLECGHEGQLTAKFCATCGAPATPAHLGRPADGPPSTASTPWPVAGRQRPVGSDHAPTVPIAPHTAVVPPPPGWPAGAGTPWPPGATPPPPGAPHPPHGGPVPSPVPPPPPAGGRTGRQVAVALGLVIAAF